MMLTRMSLLLLCSRLPPISSPGDTEPQKLRVPIPSVAVHAHSPALPYACPDRVSRVSYLFSSDGRVEKALCCHCKLWVSVFHLIKLPSNNPYSLSMASCLRSARCTGPPVGDPASTWNLWVRSNFRHHVSLYNLCAPFIYEMGANSHDAFRS